MNNALILSSVTKSIKKTCVLQSLLTTHSQHTQLIDDINLMNYIWFHYHAAHKP